MRDEQIAAKQRGGPPGPIRCGIAFLLLCVSGGALGQSKFETTDSRSDYVHQIELYDATGGVINPAAENARPYSVVATCSKCHDYKRMEHGYHFSAALPTADAGRAGEPWIWVDARSGAQIPLSYRGWPGTFRPQQLQIDRQRFIKRFGRHMAGMATQEQGETPGVRAALSGPLMMDCMLCHSADRSYSPQRWAEQTAAENFAWAATAGMGLATIERTVASLPADFDPQPPEAPEAPDTPEAPQSLPRTVYDTRRFDVENKVFFNVVRRPANNACFYCHTTRPVGAEAAARWTHDQDVHIAAGMQCADCHRNGVDHHTVRGYEGEQHPTGANVQTLSCRGCHMDTADSQGGRLGSPKPEHRGLPPLHLETMSCTSCHSGLRPAADAQPVQTAMAHELGLPRQLRNAQALPQIVSPVLARDDDGVIYPYNMFWPAYWGQLRDGQVTPLDPDAAYRDLRRALRVRRDFRSEMAGNVRLSQEDKVSVLGEQGASLTDEELSPQQKQQLEQLLQRKTSEAFGQKLATGLAELNKKYPDAAAVYVSGGKAYRLDDEGKLQTFEHEAAEPYRWAVAHDVRPARQSLGVAGCTECHAAEAPFFYSQVTALGPAVDDTPAVTTMHELQQQDPLLLTAWEQSMARRDLFKVVAISVLVIVALVLLLYLMLGLSGLTKLMRGRPQS